VKFFTVQPLVISVLKRVTELLVLRLQVIKNTLTSNYQEIITAVIFFTVQGISLRGLIPNNRVISVDIAGHNKHTN
jgi:hypothetical protein